MKNFFKSNKIIPAPVQKFNVFIEMRCVFEGRVR
mgnify:CR=1 FL=1